MDSEQLRLSRRITVLKDGTLPLTGGTLTGGLVTEGQMTVQGQLTAQDQLTVQGQLTAQDQLTVQGQLTAADGRLVAPTDGEEDVTIDGNTVWHAGNASTAGVTLFSGNVSTDQTITLTENFKNYRFVGIRINRASLTSNKGATLLPTTLLAGTSAWISFCAGSLYYLRVSDENGNLTVSSIGSDTCLTRVSGFN